MKIEKIIRTKRETIALQITDDATLIVRAPFEVSEQTIKNVVIRHIDWIERKRKEILSRDPKFVKKEFVNGEGFLYLGKYYKLTIVDRQDEPLVFNNGFFLSKNYLPIAREVFTNWYRKKAYEKISERVEWYAQKRGFKYNKVNITNAQKRWGSCSHKKNLNFSWRLIMAPLPVVDYVVVHELVHLEEKNHTKSFWNKVKMLMPDYEKHRDWLKKNGYLLRL
ncbi:M48 family peptidase [Archaeoglobales archaeon]|nr:MAG: M48 family peptidase [Archaeoglobales archaeon]